MAFVPTNKWLQEDYRRQVGVGRAPAQIDNENQIIPVAVVNPGIIRERAGQKLVYYSVLITNTSTSVQVATVPANGKLFYVGTSWQECAGNTAGTSCDVFDGNSGNAPSMTDNTMYTGALGTIVRLYGNVASKETQHYPLVPIRLMYGLRYTPSSAATSQYRAYFLTLEEYDV